MSKASLYMLSVQKSSTRPNYMCSLPAVTCITDITCASSFKLQFTCDAANIACRLIYVQALIFLNGDRFSQNHVHANTLHKNFQICEADRPRKQLATHCINNFITFEFIRAATMPYRSFQHKPRNPKQLSLY